MKIAYKIIFLSFLISLPSSHPIAISTQKLKVESSPPLDSLIEKIKYEQTDTSKIKLLNSLAWNFAPEDFGKSMLFADSALALSQKINWEKGKAQALNNMGEALRYNGEVKESLEKHHKALTIYGDLKSHKMYAQTLSNIGIAYFNISDFSQSFIHFVKSLEIFQELKNKNGELNNLGYIGILFSTNEQYEKALEYFEKALAIAKELEDQSKIATQLGNIGLVYKEMKNYDQALDHYKKALEMFLASEDHYNYSIYLGNTGLVYTETGKYSEAYKYFDESLKYAKEIDDSYGIAHQYANIGELNFRKIQDKKYSIGSNNYWDALSSSIQFYKKSVELFEQLEAKEEQKIYLFKLHKVYKLKNNYEEALSTFELAQQLQDTIHSNNNKKVIAQLEIKQELNTKNNEIDILNKNKEYNSYVRKTISTFAIFFVLVSFIILYFYFKKRKHNNILQENISERIKAERELKSKKLELELEQEHLEQNVWERTKELESEIKERKKTEEKLSEETIKAVAASKAKTTFLANMSHELRNPLLGILGYSDLLRSTLEDEEEKEMAEGINNSGKRLYNTVSLVLDLARIESDKQEINIVPLDINIELKEIYDTYRGAVINNENLKFNLNISDDPSILTVDKSMFKVIFDNLLNNAIKFTEEGEININTGIEEIKNKTFRYISISDTGIGMNQKDIPYIFQEFKQLSEGFTKDYQGSGLGLSVTKKYIEILNGKIEVKSKVGKGTEFKVYFPTDLQAAA
ncbi:MAG: sensor histidine kinase [Ignavibacteriae bacterium]|nr:sensor histidine kinase [Ignavibacteriota bacterium]